MILHVVVLISSTLGKESPRGCISCSVCRSHSKRISDPHFLIALGTHPPTHQSTLSLSIQSRVSLSLCGSKSIFWDGLRYLPSSFLTTARPPEAPDQGRRHRGRGRRPRTKVEGTMIDGDTFVIPNEARTGWCLHRQKNAELHTEGKIKVCLFC